MERVSKVSIFMAGWMRFVFPVRPWTRVTFSLVQRVPLTLRARLPQSLMGLLLVRL